MNEVIQQATRHFQALLKEQLARVESLETRGQAQDYIKLDPLIIGVIGGDGIGPQLIEASKRLLRVLLEEDLASGRVILRDIEGLTLENRLALGQALPAPVLDEIKACQVLLKDRQRLPGRDPGKRQCGFAAGIGSLRQCPACPPAGRRD